MLNQPFEPMILRKSEQVIRDNRYIHQFKWDGHRLLLHYERGKVRLFTREKNECTIQYPELKAIQLPIDSCILDGECIVIDKTSNPPMPSFEDVMTRFHSSKAMSIKKLMKDIPVHFVVWDMIFLNGRSICDLPLADRLELLNQIISNNDSISITPSYNDGQSLFRNVVKIGGEGIVSKPSNSKYKFGSCSDENAWYKTKNYQFEVVQVGAIRKKKFGWSLLHNDNYVGMLEFPPSKEISRAFYNFAKQITTKETGDWIILQPLISIKVKFQCYTREGKMRSPSFVEIAY